MLRRLFAALVILGLFAVASTARAAITFSFITEGIVFPTDPVACADPFAGCSMTALGAAAATAGDVSPLPGPWNFAATFSIVAPLSPVTFLTTGVFGFDDPTAANDDFSGLLEGVLDVTTFTNTMTYWVTSSSGAATGSALR